MSVKKCFDRQYSITEEKRINTPTAKDIKDTERLLKDFEIVVAIPQFETIAELSRWKQTVLKAM